MTRASGALRRALGPRAAARHPSRPLELGVRRRHRVRVSVPSGGSQEGPSWRSRPAEPASDPAAERSSDDQRHRSPRAGGLVLVVDDNAGFRGLAARILTTWGYEVIEAGSIADAVRCVVERRPHAVIVDIGLPDGDGFGLTERLVALPSAPRVVLISTDADAGNRSAAHRAGAVGFLPKDELLGGALQELIKG